MCNAKILLVGPLACCARSHIEITSTFSVAHDVFFTFLNWNSIGATAVFVVVAVVVFVIGSVVWMSVF